MYNGVIWFYGSDTSSIILNKDTFEKVIKPGRYIIQAWHVGYIGTKTKKIDIKLNTKVDVNFYLGTVVEN